MTDIVVSRLQERELEAWGPAEPDIVVARRSGDEASADVPQQATVELVRSAQQAHRTLIVVADFSIDGIGQPDGGCDESFPVAFSAGDRAQGRAALLDALYLDLDEHGPDGGWWRFERINRRFANRAARLAPRRGPCWSSPTVSMSYRICSGSSVRIYGSSSHSSSEYPGFGRSTSRRSPGRFLGVCSVPTPSCAPRSTTPCASRSGRLPLVSRTPAPGAS